MDHVYNLMSRRPDKQDRSLIEKIHLPEDQVFQLCNDFYPGLISITEHGWKLQKSSSLDHRFGVIGFYGNKKVMKLLWTQHNLGGEEVRAKMEREELEPGLYGCWHSDILCLLYWHSGGEMEEARRSSLSCSFVRYLFELCDIVYACMEVKDTSALPSLTASKAIGKKRNQRVRISLVKASKDDVKIVSEYSIFLTHISSFGRDTSAKFVKFSQNAQKSALLISRRVPPTTLFTKQCHTLSNKQAMEEYLFSCSSNFDIDILELQEDDLVLFLTLWGRTDESEEMKKNLQIFQDKVAHEENKSAKLDTIVAKSLRKILRQTAEWFTMYMRKDFPLEEHLLAVSTNFAEELPTSSNNLLYSQKEFVNYRATFIHRDHPTQEPFDEFDCPLFDSTGCLNVLLVGNVFGFDGASSTSRLGTFRVMSSGGRKSGPVLYGDDVIVECSSKPFPSMMFVFCPPDKSRKSMTGTVVWNSDQFTFDSHSQPPSIHLHHVGRSKVESSQIVNLHTEQEASITRKWVEECVKRFIPPLEKRAALANFFVTNAKDYGIEVNNAFIPGILTNGYNFVKELLEEKHREVVEQKWDSVMESNAYLGLDSLLPSVKSHVLDIYKHGRTRAMSYFYDTIDTMVKPSIKNRLQAQLNLIITCAKQDAIRRKTDFIKGLKQKLSTRRTGAPAIKIMRCVKNKRLKGLIADSFTIEFIMEEKLPEQVAWSMIECVPMREDVEMLTSKPGHVVRLTSSTFKECPLTQLDPAAMVLGNVALLRSDKILFWAQDVHTKFLNLYLISRISVGMSSKDPIKTLKRGVDLVAFDELSNFIAFYSTTESTIQVYRLEEAPPKLLWTGIEFSTQDYVQVGTITYMQFVPRKEEILCIDDSQNVWIFELNSKLLKPRSLHIAVPFLQALVSPDGTSLLVTFIKNDVEDDAGANKQIEKTLDHANNSSLWVEAFSLGGSFPSIACLKLDVPLRGTIDTSIVMFGSQVQLLISETGKPEIIYSKILHITSASEVCELQAEDRKQKDHPDKTFSYPEMTYFYYAFEKYAITAPLIETPEPRKVCFSMVLDGLGLEKSTISNFTTAAQAAVNRLKREKGRDSLLLDVVCEANVTHNLTLTQLQGKNCMADWILHLMCLVPVQIARAENNSLKPLIGGFEIPTNVNFTDALSLASALEFGFYDGMLNSWMKEVKVLSSMGKQSSGKSYLLNHLSGSLLDVSGGRCTDGVWMTLRPTQSCLYVILDFEGLGSFERSDQEDMLLSILNAAISNITIYNKKDFHLDKETEILFDRFQNGVSLIKQDDKLFKGLFYIAIKDVAVDDIDELIDEFYSKIHHICNSTQDNFLTKMYGGQVEIAAMPPFNQPEFYDNIHDIANTIKGLGASYGSGRNFLRDLKLLIAQITSKDWTPIDWKRTGLKLKLLQNHLHASIATGALAGSAKEQLVNFDTEEIIPDMHILIVGNTELQVCNDYGLQLSPFLETRDMGPILETLQFEFEKVAPRTQVDDNLWHKKFEEFLLSLVKRREDRVLDWIKANTKEIVDNGDVERLMLEAIVMLSELKQNVTLCSCTCEHCCLKCVLGKGHSEDHTCKGNHKCIEKCTYCKEQKTGTGILDCGDVAGHASFHNCGVEVHTCSKTCDLYEKSSNCNHYCAKKVGHHDEHICNSRQHLCNKSCSLPACKNNCIQPLEMGEHDSHECHEKVCPLRCNINGCNRQCVKDHLHSLVSPIDDHFCSSEHPCMEKCQAKGNCEVLTEFTKQKSVFHGKRSEFEYEYVTEQNGIRKDCCLAIPPFKYKHEGPHVHSKNTNIVHFCDTRCQGCGYFCNIPIDHVGLHETIHGNMRNMIFVADSEDIDIADRKYAWGESGKAEMCMMHCKVQGRGHVHLIKCERPPNVIVECTTDVQKESGAACAGIRLPEGARHQTKAYGPNFDVKKDELTHEAYWKHMRFKDPCTEQDREQFKLCNHYCPSTEHTLASCEAGRSYCNEKLWHAPVLTKPKTGYLSKDGHRFGCNHSSGGNGNHIIFVIDRSFSMSDKDATPSMTEFRSTHNNRLGCVYDAIMRFLKTRIARKMNDTISAVVFNGSGDIAFEREDMEEKVVMKLKQFYASGCTYYYAGLEEAEAILKRSSIDEGVKKKSPAIVFLSDGEDLGRDPVECVKRMKVMEPKLVVSTVKFGQSSDNKRLIDMAKAGGGSFQLTLDQIQLAETFQGLARSIGPQVSSLIGM